MHEGHAIGDLADEAHLVADDDHRHALVGELAHDIEHLGHHLGIQGRGRFVEQHQGRLHGERPGDRHPLLLAARQEIGEGVGLVAQVHALEQPARDLPRLGGALAEDFPGPERDVLQRREMRKQVERLEHHADVTPQVAQGRTPPRHLGALEADAAAIGRLQPIDAAQQRALARAAGAANRDDVAGRDRQAHVLQHLQGAEALVEVRDLERHAHGDDPGSGRFSSASA